MSDELPYAYETSARAMGDSSAALGPMRRQQVRRRSDWRQGGTSVRRWDATLLAIALAGVGIGVLSSVALAAADALWSSNLSSVALWGAMLAVIASAFHRSKPARILAFRPVDLVWGVGFGVCLRVLQGWLSRSDTGPFPSALALDGTLPSDWWLTGVVSTGLIAPLVEEFFFRAVVLVTIYQVLRRGIGPLAAGVTSALVSAGSFVLLHAAFVAASLATGVQLFVVGLTFSVIVLLTGRIWGAVIAHIVYNGTFLALVLVGSVLR